MIATLAAHTFLKDPFQVLHACSMHILHLLVLLQSTVTKHSSPFNSGFSSKIWYEYKSCKRICDLAARSIQHDIKRCHAMQLLGTVLEASRLVNRSVGES
eukprot:s1289_g13.t1